MVSCITPSEHIDDTAFGEISLDNSFEQAHFPFVETHTYDNVSWASTPVISTQLRCPVVRRDAISFLCNYVSPCEASCVLWHRSRAVGRPPNSLQRYMNWPSVWLNRSVSNFELSFSAHVFFMEGYQELFDDRTVSITSSVESHIPRYRHSARKMLAMHTVCNIPFRIMPYSNQYLDTPSPERVEGLMQSTSPVVAAKNKSSVSEMTLLGWGLSVWRPDKDTCPIPIWSHKFPRQRHSLNMVSFGSDDVKVTFWRSCVGNQIRYDASAGLYVSRFCLDGFSQTREGQILPSCVFPKHRVIETTLDIYICDDHSSCITEWNFQHFLVDTDGFHMICICHWTNVSQYMIALCYVWFKSTTFGSKSIHIQSDYDICTQQGLSLESFLAKNLTTGPLQLRFAIWQTWYFTPLLWFDFIWFQLMLFTGFGRQEYSPNKSRPRWIGAARWAGGRRICGRRYRSQFRRTVDRFVNPYCPILTKPSTPLIFRSFDFSPYVGIRVGEACNPGPLSEILDVANINPTQLLHKEDDIIQMGRGIYTISESSVTQAALQVLRPKLHKAGFFAKWSEPVEPVHAKTSVLRGKASGVAILSTFPIRPLHEPIPQNIENARRFVDGVVQLEANCSLYVASVYGVAESAVNTNSRGITNEIFNVAAERALGFQGPAIISGDLNTELENILAWKTLLTYGWEDCAIVDSRIHNRLPQPTCNEKTRRSFVLANRQMMSHLSSCRTCPDYLFAVHPMLVAQFRLASVVKPYLGWCLPQSTDNCLFDKELLNETALHFCQLHDERFQEAITARQPDRAARIFAEAVESSWKASSVDVDGNLRRLRPGCFGRGHHQPVRKVCPSTPVVRKARDGDFEPLIGQGTVEIRRHTRQLRRLESLCSQLKALERHHTIQGTVKCTQLWDAILQATGFSTSFASWIFEHFQWFVPLTLPGVLFVDVLKDLFRKWHTRQVQMYCLNKKRDRRRSIALDIPNGGRLAFADAKEAPVAPLTHVVTERTIPVCKTRWKKTGVCILKLQDQVPLPLGDGYRYTFQGQLLDIIDVQGKLVHLRKPVKLKNSTFSITQKFVTADSTEMLTITAQAWNQHWLRDPQTHLDDDWSEMERILFQIQPVPPMVETTITKAVWEGSIRNLNKKSARGGCGFSVTEMMNFPDAILDWLFQIYSACETGMKWPHTWVLAKVAMLSKTSRPATPFDARPITIFSVLYRQWARIRSREILRYMATYMPRSIATATARVPADSAAALIAVLAEHAVNHGTTLAGLGIDLQRCFNTLARYPLTRAMQRLGIPSRYISGWSQMLQDMTRTICIGLAHCAPMASTTGVPEGCGMSVTAMAVITWWQASVIMHDHSQVRPIAYADNWNLVSPQVQCLVDATETLVHFVHTLRLTISPTKSWVWATNASSRRQLKGFTIDGVALPVVCNIADLGCDINYSRRTRKSKLNLRWGKINKKCTRIRHCQVPRSFKHRMAQSIGFQGATFGTSIQHVTKAQWASLRANLARAIQLSRAGASSWLALGTCNADPQMRHLKQCLKFWRRFIYMFPDIGLLFQDSLQQTGVSRVGPAACFRLTLKDAGWSFLNPRQVRHNPTGFTIDWLECSAGFLRHIIEYAWTFCVVDAVTHRKDWDSTSMDCFSFQQSVNKLVPRKAWVIRSFASGKHYTNNIIHKYHDDVSATCPCCDEIDGKEHRLFHCKGLKDLRKPYGDLLRRAKTLGTTFTCYGIPPHAGDIRMCAPDVFENTIVVVHPPATDVVRHVFVDGSAFGQENPCTTVGSWAIVECCYLQNDFQILHSGFIPGCNHNSYRGEICAVLFAMQKVYQGYIYTDCEAVLSVFSHLEDVLERDGPLPNVDHIDLWRHIWELLQNRPHRSCKLVKVKAHLDYSCATSLLEKWYIHGNDFADRCAKAVVSDHPVHRKLTRLVGRHSRISQLTRDYHNYVCLVAETILDQQAKVKISQKQEHKEMLMVPSFHDLRIHDCNNFVYLPEFCDLHCALPYGDVFYNRYRQWLSQVRWPNRAPGAGLGSYVSLLELYGDFVVTTQTETPIHQRDAKGGHVYFLLDQHPLMQLEKFNLSAHTKIWHHTWEWVFKHFANLCCFDWSDKQVLNHLGFSIQCAAFDRRPALVGDLAGYKALWKFFHQPGGRRRNLGYPFRPLPGRDG